jgi:hypothetical protein
VVSSCLDRSLNIQNLVYRCSLQRFFLQARKTPNHLGDVEMAASQEASLLRHSVSDAAASQAETGAQKKVISEEVTFHTQPLVKNQCTISFVLIAAICTVYGGLHAATNFNPNTMLHVHVVADENASENGSTTTTSYSKSQRIGRVDILRLIDNEAGDYNNDLNASGSGGNSTAGGAAADDVAGGDDTAGGEGVVISSSDARQYIYPNSFTSTLSKRCVDTLWSHCNSGGADKCRWKASACNYNNHDCLNLTGLFPNRTLVFRGDSTLREQFSVWSFYCCPWAPPVLKSDTNMTSRDTVTRHHPMLGLKSYFHFDYLFDHLLDPIPAIPEGAPIDAVVVGLGMYQAKAITTNRTDQDSLQSIQSEKVHHIVTSVCDVHKAKVGFFVGGWMECVAMRKHKAKVVRQNGKVCPQSAQLVSVINRIVKFALMRQKPRKDGCYVHYIPAMKCRGQRRTCTGDGVHARSASAYGNTKFQLLFNAAKVVFQTRPEGM